MDVTWQSANHQSVERELLAKQCQRDREQLELQRGHSAGRKVQRGGLYRKLQRNECTACELLSEWSHWPLVSEFVHLAISARMCVWPLLVLSGGHDRRRRLLR